MPKPKLIPKSQRAALPRLPQYRVLLALMPKNGRKPVKTRQQLSEAAGFRPGTGTANRVLNGIPEGSSSGTPHPGIVAAGWVTRHDVELDGGVKEIIYEITAAGIRAVKAFAQATGRTAPGEVRSADVSTNARYQVS